MKFLLRHSARIEFSVLRATIFVCCADVVGRPGGPRSVVAVCISPYGRDRSASLQYRYLVAAVGRFELE